MREVAMEPRSANGNTTREELDRRREELNRQVRETDKRTRAVRAKAEDLERRLRQAVSR